MGFLGNKKQSRIFFTLIMHCIKMSQKTPKNEQSVTTHFKAVFRGDLNSGGQVPLLTSRAITGSPGALNEVGLFYEK